MRLNRGEGNGASLAGRTSRNTDRIARIIDNMVICRIFVQFTRRQLRSMRSVFSHSSNGLCSRSVYPSAGAMQMHLASDYIHPYRSASALA